MISLLLTSNRELATGFRLTGMRVCVAHSDEMLFEEFDKATKNPDLGILFVSESDCKILEGGGIKLEEQSFLVQIIPGKV